MKSFKFIFAIFLLLQNVNIAAQIKTLSKGKYKIDPSVRVIVSKHGVITIADKIVDTTKTAQKNDGNNDTQKQTNKSKVNSKKNKGISENKAGIKSGSGNGGSGSGGPGSGGPGSGGSGSGNIVRTTSLLDTSINKAKDTTVKSTPTNIIPKDLNLDNIIKGLPQGATINITNNYYYGTNGQNGNQQNGNSQNGNIKNPDSSSLSIPRNVIPENQKISKFFSKFGVTGGFGLANYLGDIVERANPFRQTSFSLTGGITYKIIPRINARADLSWMKLHAFDSKNSRYDLRERNLSFKTFIWDLSTSVEIDVLNPLKHKLVPYVTGGLGVFYFNPYTIDRHGAKRYLQSLGTEGQGLMGNPNYYHKIQANYPIGGGFKFSYSDNITFQLEFKYRFTETDYIDDISRLGYPDRSKMIPSTLELTYRGDEIGGVKYPYSGNLNRGNPFHNDAFYTTQVKFIYALGSNHEPKEKKEKKKKEKTIKKPFVPAVIPDTDGDGINDKEDKCPTLKGSSKYRGCPIPDTDKDSVNDEEDKCPTVFGTVKNNGCPEIKNLISNPDSAKCYTIYFDVNKSNLSSESTQLLANLISQLKNNPSLSVVINGYTDNYNAGVMANLKLSEVRANNVANYIISYYINKNRITARGFGQENPVRDNRDASVNWQNNRVEICLYSK